MTLHWWLNMGPVAVVENVIKPMYFELLCQEGRTGSVHKWDPKDEKFENHSEKCVVLILALGPC